VFVQIGDHSALLITLVDDAMTLTIWKGVNGDDSFVSRQTVDRFWRQEVAEASIEGFSPVGSLNAYRYE
jgi:hypothetical protein